MIKPEPDFTRLPGTWSLVKPGPGSGLVPMLLFFVNLYILLLLGENINIISELDRILDPWVANFIFLGKVTEVIGENKLMQ